MSKFFLNNKVREPNATYITCLESYLLNLEIWGKEKNISSQTAEF